MALLEVSPGRLGHRLNQVEVAGLRVNHASYSAESTTPPHVHPHGDLCVPLAGNYEERWRGDACAIEVGMTVLKPAETWHANRFGREDSTCLNIEFSSVAWDEIVGDGAKAHRIFSDPGLIRIARELEGEMRAPDRWSSLAAEGLVLSLVATALRVERKTRPGPEPWLEAVRDRLHAEFASNLRMDELAAEAGVHPSHLARRFRRRFGRSVGGYVRDLRIAAALEGLSREDASMGDVALGAGFSDQSHMGRVLRRETGMTPGQWRGRSRSVGESGRSIRRGSF